jgi:nucleoid-associated protein YgaU
MSMLMSLLQHEKAKLSIHLPENGKIGLPDGPPIVFQFNPAMLSITKSSPWSPSEADKAAPSAQGAQYVGPGPAALNLDLLLDSKLDPYPNITSIVTRLNECLVAHKPTVTQGTPFPKFVRFTWGAWKWGNGSPRFEGYVTSVKTDYQLFSSDGEPIRAKVTIAIKEYAPRTPGQNPTSGTLVPQHSRILRTGDTLASVAWEEYGDPTLWRELAEANGIDDPLRLAPGTQLLVPRRRPPHNGR